MPTQSEVEEALRRIGGSGNTLQITNQLRKDGTITEYKNSNVTVSIVSRTLSRLYKWGTVRKEYRETGPTGKRLTGKTTWVLAEIEK